MLRLFKFFVTYANVLVFWLLLGVSFWMSSLGNERQRHVVGDVGLEVSGWINERQTRVVNYFQKDEQLDALRSENRELTAKINRLRNQNRHYLGLMQRDSIKWTKLQEEMPLSSEVYEYIPCQIVRSTLNMNDNFIYLNKGKRHGIRKNMGVISTRGIAAKVIKVSDNYCIALSALNRSFKLSAKTRTGGHLGVFSWEGNDLSFGKLDIVPTNATIQVGDTVETSGEGISFPEGYPIGMITAYKPKREDAFYDIKVRLLTEFQRLKHVYVVSPVHPEEWAELEKGVVEE